MAEQSRLEIEGIEKRDSLQIQNTYYDDVASGSKNEYSFGHPDTMSDGDRMGKGTGVEMGYSIANPNAPKEQISYGNFITRENGDQTIGGLYDIEGTKGIEGAFQGNSGRKFLSTVNKYGPGEGREYGLTSVDTSKNKFDGQIVVD